jgi:GTPase SAR1 family protein
MKKMQARKPNINADSNAERIKINNTTFFHTRFNFIKQHNGLRPNKMHVFVAPTHVGKSTLTHALIDDLITRNDGMKVLLYLTEETLDDFETAVARFVIDGSKMNKSLTVMVEDKSCTDKEIMESIEDRLMHTDYQLLVVDNITTSKLYMDRKTDIQSSVAVWLKGLLTDTTLFLIAHTASNNYNTDLLDETSIRGSKTICNITEFLYVMQPVRLNDSLKQYIRIVKHRQQEPASKFFQLVYNSRLKTITEDHPCNFEDFKSVFKLRNKL